MPTSLARHRCYAYQPPVWECPAAGALLHGHAALVYGVRWYGVRWECPEAHALLHGHAALVYGVRWYGVRWYGVRWYGVRWECLAAGALLHGHAAPVYGGAESQEGVITTATAMLPNAGMRSTAAGAPKASLGSFTAAMDGGIRIETLRAMRLPALCACTARRAPWEPSRAPREPRPWALSCLLGCTGCNTRTRGPLHRAVRSGLHASAGAALSMACPALGSCIGIRARRHLQPCHQ
jgi:hypothetical protein